MNNGINLTNFQVDFFDLHSEIEKKEIRKELLKLYTKEKVDLILKN